MVKEKLFIMRSAYARVRHLRLSLSVQTHIYDKFQKHRLTIFEEKMSFHIFFRRVLLAM